MSNGRHPIHKQFVSVLRAGSAPRRPAPQRKTSGTLLGSWYTKLLGVYKRSPSGVGKMTHGELRKATKVLREKWW